MKFGVSNPSTTFARRVQLWLFEDEDEEEQPDDNSLCDQKKVEVPSKLCKEEPGRDCVCHHNKICGSGTIHTGTIADESLIPVR